MSFYITPQEVKDFSQLDQIKNLTDAVIQQKIELAQFKIEAYCNQSFLKESKVKELDGTGSNLLVLPEKCIKVNSVFFDFRNMASNIVIANDGWGLKLKSSFQFDYQLRDRIESLPTFTSGVANIIVDADWGWEQIPKEVIYCTKKLAEGFCLFVGDEEVLMAETGIYKKQTIGGYSYELKDSRELTSTESTGDATVDTLLKKYKRTIKKNGMKVGVV